jgi:hypothetical protein
MEVARKKIKKESSTVAKGYLGMRSTFINLKKW